MRSLGIIQPGRIGDVVICLPIAKHYSDQGCSVLWPVADFVYRNFVGHVPYVHFSPINSLDCNEARARCAGSCNMILDLSIYFPNGNTYNDNIFNQVKDKMTFDEVKYLFAGLPFHYRWSNFSVVRDMEREMTVYKKFNIREPFIFLHEDPARGLLIDRKHVRDDVRIVRPQDIVTDSIFDFLYTMEQAQEIHSIDSCMRLLYDSVVSEPKNALFYHLNLAGGRVKDITHSQSFLDWKVI